PISPRGRPASWSTGRPVASASASLSPRRCSSGAAPAFPWPTARRPTAAPSSRWNGRAPPWMSPSRPVKAPRLRAEVLGGRPARPYKPPASTPYEALGRIGDNPSMLDMEPSPATPEMSLLIVDDDKPFLQRLARAMEQ